MNQWKEATVKQLHRKAKMVSTISYFATVISIPVGPFTLVYVGIKMLYAITVYVLCRVFWFGCWTQSGAGLWFGSILGPV